jgi:hypothetical protein
MLTLKVLGPLLTGAGSLLLAWRVKKILDGLVIAQVAAQENFQSLAAFLGNQTQDLKLIGGLDTNAERSHRFGIFLLVIGFLLIAAGGFISAYAIWVSA